jgi:putative ABC transport system ATP-binding protein
MIKVKGLYKSYHDGEHEVIPLNETEFSCNIGDFVLIVGRSGTGKTTLLNAIGGLTMPDRGTVLVGGHDILSLSDKENAAIRSNTIGFVFQFPGLLSSLTTLENVILPTEIAGKTPSAEKGLNLLERVGLGKKVQSSPSQLSGGELKRTSIARALINDPLLILADEPTADLDYETEIEIMDLFAEINKGGTTIVMVTHNVDLVRYATRVFQMIHGKLIEVPQVPHNAAGN